MVHRFLVVGALAVGALVLGACGDDDAGRATTPETRPPGSTSTDLAVTGTDSLRFEPDTFNVPAGEEVTLAFSADSGVEHDFVVEDAADVGVVGNEGHNDEGQGVASGDLAVVHAKPGETATGTFMIDEPGIYQVYCSVTGHREAGMVATLTVVDGA